MSSGYSKSGLSEWIITFKPWLLPRIQGRIGYIVSYLAASHLYEGPADSWYMTNTAAVLPGKKLRILLHSHVCGDIHGWWNRSSRPGNHRTNVCCMVPEKPADAISVQHRGSYNTSTKKNLPDQGWSASTAPASPDSLSSWVKAPLSPPPPPPPPPYPQGFHHLQNGTVGRARHMISCD